MTTSKTIFAIGLDASVFKFVAFKELLEVEAGYTSNEPPQMAVLEAIEKTVYSIILEGILAGLWSFADPKAGEEAVKKYLLEKNAMVMAEFDHKGQLKAITRYGKIQIIPSEKPRRR